MIKKQENGLYLVRVTKYINGKQRDFKYRNIATLGEAKGLEKKALVDLEKLKSDLEIGVGTWAQARTQFLSDYKSQVEYSTYYTYEKSLNGHTHVWDDKLVNEITSNEIRTLIEGVHQTESIATKQSFAKHIRAVFKKLVESGVLKHNPVSGVSFGKKMKKKLEAMTRQEILNLLSYAKSSDSPWYSIFRVTYELGLRSGEAVALQWTDVDFENLRVSINKAYCSKSKVMKPPKNGEARTIVLNKKLADYLKSLKLETATTGFVLPRISKWIRGEAAKYLRQMQSELNMRQTNYHSLRASFITHLLLDGVAVTKVQHLVGHKELSTTEDYVRLIASDLDGATDSLSLDLDTEGKVLQLATGE